MKPVRDERLIPITEPRDIPFDHVMAVDVDFVNVPTVPATQ